MLLIFFIDGVDKQPKLTNLDDFSEILKEFEVNLFEKECLLQYKNQKILLKKKKKQLDQALGNDADDVEMYFRKIVESSAYK